MSQPQIRDVVISKVGQEAIRGINHVWGQTITVDVGDPDQPKIDGIYVISGANYMELMSASPAWGIGKPAGTFRMEDLWIMIDRIRAEPEPPPAIPVTLGAIVKDKGRT